MDLLLDSSVLFRLIYEPSFIAQATRNKLRDPVNRLYVSHATLWESLAKVYRGHILQDPVSLQSEIESIEQLGAVLVPITQEDVLATIALPDHHRDPFDRMLIAQAQRLSATIVSSDRILSRYNIPVIPL